MPKIIGSDKWEFIEKKIDWYMDQCTEKLGENPEAYMFNISIESFLELARVVLSKEQMVYYDQQIMKKRLANLEAKYKNIDKALAKTAFKKMKGETQDENH